MTAHNSPGYTAAHNALTDVKSSPEGDARAQTILDQINARRAAHLAMAPLADLRNPKPEPEPISGALVAWVMVFASMSAIGIVILIRLGWGF